MQLFRTPPQKMMFSTVVIKRKKEENLVTILEFFWPVGSIGSLAMSLQLVALSLYCNCLFSYLKVAFFAFAILLNLLSY